MSNKSFWLLFAALAFALCIALSKAFYADYEVYTRGINCKVVIQSLPSGGQSNGDFMYFYLNNERGSKKVYGNYGILHKVGDTIELKYLPEFKDHYLFIDENPIPWGIYALGFIGSCGFACIYYAFKKEPPTVRMPWQRKK